MSDRKQRGIEFYKRLAKEDAERRGLTSEEYGVYKGSVGSVVEPINSAGGLLVISIILSLIGLFTLVLIGILIGQQTGALPPGNPDDTETIWKPRLDLAEMSASYLDFLKGLIPSRPNAADILQARLNALIPYEGMKLYQLSIYLPKKGI